MNQPGRSHEFTGRPESAVFSDLAFLAIRPGYVHAIAYLCYHNNMIGFGAKMTPEDMLKHYSNEHLIRGEIATLVGLLVKGEIDLSLPSPEAFQSYISDSERLLQELHHCMSVEMMRSIIPEQGEFSGLHGLSKGAALREPIFYGGESAYIFQYRDFATERYQADNTWIIENKGFCIESAKQISLAITRIQNRKIHSTYQEMIRRDPDTWTILPGFFLTAEEISSESTIEVAQVERFLQSFVHSGTNQEFQSVSDFNAVNSSPLIRIGGGQYLLFQQYGLAEALYESPAYWMMQDRAYSARAAENRGQFTEAFSERHLSHVFGDKNVHRNINIVSPNGTVACEVDVLVVFGDRIIVLQAKSKRLTIAARKGNDGVIQDDFRKAIQGSYDQSLMCATHILAGDCKLVDSRMQEIQLDVSPKEIFPFCVVSDHYPALSFQARQFLEYKTTDAIRPPFVMDLFLLDAMTEMLESPLRLLSYVKQRAEYAERLSVTHELTALSYHLKHNLWLDDDMDHVTLAEDLAVDLDLAMSARRDGLPGSRTPDGILTRLSGPLGGIVKSIEFEQDPDTIEVGFVLLMLNESTCRSVNDGLHRLSEMARRDGRTHDMSIGIEGFGEGITFHCSPASNPEASMRLIAHCDIKKHAQHANKWFGLCLDVDMNLRFGITLESPWEASADMDMMTTILATKPTRPDVASRRPGRNDPCPCGSGMKHKRCCMRR